MTRIDIKEIKMSSPDREKEREMLRKIDGPAKKARQKKRTRRANPRKVA